MMSCERGRSFTDSRRLRRHPKSLRFKKQKVQAYRGPLPRGAKGVEFQTGVRPDSPHGPIAEWSGPREGVRVENDFAKRSLWIGSTDRLARLIHWRSGTARSAALNPGNVRILV